MDDAEWEPVAGARFDRTHGWLRNYENVRHESYVFMVMLYFILGIDGIDLDLCGANAAKRPDRDKYASPLSFRPDDQNAQRGLLMPILAAVPVGAAAGGGTPLGGGAILGGLTASQIAAAMFYSAALVVTGVLALDVISDALDTPVTQSEAETIAGHAGDASKAERERLRGCAECIWCQVNIQAQGTLIYGADVRPTRQGIGPLPAPENHICTRRCDYRRNDP